MATDRDKHANVLDNRFNRVAFRVRAGTPDRFEALCAYITLREKEADPGIGDFFRFAHLLAVRKEVPLFADRDPGAEAIESRARESSPARRIAEAYATSRENNEDLATAYARREVRWIEGCLSAQPGWADVLDGFSQMKDGLVDHLVRHHRAVYLKMEEAQRVRKDRVDQAALICEEIPANL